MMIYLIFILNLIALIVSVIWFIKSNYEYEPLISIISSSTTLLGFFYYRDSIKNLAVIKGDENRVEQIGEGHKSDVSGKKNVIKQK
jgi:hypothetical protein